MRSPSPAPSSTWRQPRLSSPIILIYAGIVFLVAGCFDMLDGALARLAQKVTPFGAFLDSTLDSVSEGVILAAIAYLLAVQGRSIDVALVVLALLGSVLVSYTRARAESLGVECKVGLMSRPERVILIAMGLFFDVLPYVIYIMLALTVFTVDPARRPHLPPTQQAKGTGRIR